MLFAAGGTVSVVGGMVFAMGDAVFAVDGAVSLQNRRLAPCQPPSLLRFRCIWVKRLLQAGVALYTKAV